MWRFHLVAVGAAIAKSVAYFLQGTSFVYGGKLVAAGEMKFDDVYRLVFLVLDLALMVVKSISFRIFVVISVTMSVVGKAMAFISDYAKAKAAALRILWLQQRVSEIDPHDQSGIILVRSHLTDQSETLSV